MYPVSAAFRSTLTRSHRIVTRVEVYDSGSLASTLSVVIEGEVSVEKSAAVRRRCSLRIVDVDGTLVPSVATDLLAPVGNELKLYRGIRFDDGTPDEILPLGVFQIANPQIEDTKKGVTIALQGYDRSRRIRRNRFVDPYVIASGTNYATGIQNLILDRLPGTVFNFMSTANTTPALVFSEEQGVDPWEQATRMAESIGAELFFDPNGICVLRPEPSPLTDPAVWTYAEGADATLLSVRRSMDDEQSYNGVIVTGESPANSVPVRAEAWDTDPSSPTYYLGDYGKVPRFYKSEFITTTDQAQDAASALLQKSLGLLESAAMSAIVNPAHDAGDVIEMTRAKSKVSGMFLAESFTIPLSPKSPMTASMRKRRVA